ncbi:MAG: ExeM/NucH family extracellular endonuclease [Vicinamibacterales bacterium]
MITLVSGSIRTVRLLALAFLLACVWHPTPAAAQSELFFSEYVEGSSNNKALEIYNPTGDPVDLAADGYSVQMFFNGSTTASLTINLSGTLAAGDVFVLAHASANAAILAQADQTNGSGWFNGDDVVVLRRATTTIDAVGQVGVDPGTEWGAGTASTADNTLRRRPSLCTGDPETADPFDPAAEWDGFATDTFDGLGTHAVTCTAVDLAPSVSSTNPVDGGSVSPSANLTVTFSEPVNVTGTWFSLACTSGPKPATVSGGPTTFTIDPDGDLAAGDACELTIAAANVSDVDATDPPDTLASDVHVLFSVVNVCALPFTSIPAIQGSGATAAIVGPVTTQGVVIGDYEVPAGSGQMRGFYIQDPAGDGDPSTSDAIFVFNGGTDSVSLGQIVRVSGTAGEFQGQTQIGSVSAIANCGTGTVAPVNVMLPLASADALERVEGMLVRLPQTLYVTEHFQLGRFGEVVVSSGGRLDQPTDVHRPGPQAAALQAANDLNRIVIDDANNSQNADPIVFGRNGAPLSASNTLRGGDAVTGPVGVLTYTWAGNAASGNAFRVRPIGALGGQVEFVAANPRPAAAPPRTGSLRVAGMNLLNFFNTFDGLPDTTDACAFGVGGAPADCRGADTADEFARQWPKTVAAIVGSGADVIGVIEVENVGYGPDSAIQFLVGRLNDASPSDPYAFIDVDAATGQSNALGTDAIKVGVLYKTGQVAPVGLTAVLNTDAFVNAGDSGPRNRPAIAQAFEELRSGARFVVSVNHLKSKGSACDVPDALDGQGECNIVRTNAARELASWLASDPTGIADPDVLILGDLNAYGMEDPVQALGDAGYLSLVRALNAGRSYSYAFDGQWGSLDHALASGTLAPQATAAADWAINADEPSVLDYNTNFKSAGQIAALYAADGFRVADHNPVLVDLALDPDGVSTAQALGLGQLTLNRSAGTAMGDPGTRLSVLVNAKARPGSPAAEGSAMLSFVRTEADTRQHRYLAQTVELSSVRSSLATGQATVIGRVALWDITQPLRPRLIDGEATLRLTMTDAGTPGVPVDTLGATVWSGTGTLWFSSAFDGVRTVEQPLSFGNLVVR